MISRPLLFVLVIFERIDGHIVVMLLMLGIPDITPLLLDTPANIHGKLTSFSLDRCIWPFSVFLFRFAGIAGISMMHAKQSETEIFFLASAAYDDCETLGEGPILDSVLTSLSGRGYFFVCWGSSMDFRDLLNSLINL